VVPNKNPGIVRVNTETEAKNGVYNFKDVDIRALPGISIQLALNVEGI